MRPPRPTTVAGRAGLAALLAEPERALVAVDFDGTLAPIVERAEDARPVAGGLAALRGAADTFGHVAVITGRPAGWVVEAAGLAAVPGLIVLGQYGAERWAGGDLRETAAHAGLAAVRAALPGLVTAKGARVEDKGLSVVVHTRAAEHPDAALAALVGPVRALAVAHGLTAHLGRYVVEIRPPGFDKGVALRELVSECQAGTVLFAGDDLGDLPAFAEVAALRERGIPGVTVCSASAEVAHLADQADLVVDGPAAVAALLVGLAESAAGPSA